MALYKQYIPAALGLLNPYELTGTNMPYAKDGDKFFGTDDVYLYSHDTGLLQTGLTTIPGIGFLPAGLIMAVITGEGPQKGKIMPFDFGVGITAVASSTLTVGEAAGTVFQKGDVVGFAASAGAAATSMGAITAIDAEAGTITVTDAGSAAQGNFVTFSNSGPIGILDQSTETGDAGGITTVCFSNAVFKKPLIWNLTEDAVTALGAKIVNNALILK